MRARPFGRRWDHATRQRYGPRERRSEQRGCGVGRIQQLARTEFGVEPRISFETLGNGTPISTIGLPLALVNDYTPQGLIFSYVQADGGAGVGVSATRAWSTRRRHGESRRHASGVGRSVLGFTLGETTITFDPAAGLPPACLCSCVATTASTPSPRGIRCGGNALGATRVSTTSYTSQNGFFVVRQDVMEIQSSVGIAGISMNLPAAVWQSSWTT